MVFVYLFGWLAAQASRDALLDEVSFLSCRNAEYEDKTKFVDDIIVVQKQNNTLLILLGEKEECIEDLTSDLKEVKNLYKAEIESLMNRLLDS